MGHYVYFKTTAEKVPTQQELIDALNKLCDETTLVWRLELPDFRHAGGTITIIEPKENGRVLECRLSWGAVGYREVWEKLIAVAEALNLQLFDVEYEPGTGMSLDEHLAVGEKAFIKHEVNRPHWHVVITEENLDDYLIKQRFASERMMDVFGLGPCPPKRLAGEPEQENRE